LAHGEPLADANSPSIVSDSSLTWAPLICRGGFVYVIALK
jgi:hypothetical protein